jgi:hypothetical protein
MGDLGSIFCYSEGSDSRGQEIGGTRATSVSCKVPPRGAAGRPKGKINL